MKRRILYHLREGKYIGSATFMLFQEPVDDLGLGFLFGEVECHELDELIAGDLADGGLAVPMGAYPMDGSISGVAGWRFTTYYNMWQNSRPICVVR